ncbi:calcium-binding protein [Lingula anatina]|uniref:Calcium-binding protein n=1 Tax=Lingula anatina TaxID=7574 RepID=A0A1S3K9Y4_LINAN|nr:calcium-binding protein [Lingula anatina]|eukprot:XP_013419061.1 calcium-binding protein [Lingula anatina]
MGSLVKLLIAACVIAVVLQETRAGIVTKRQDSGDQSNQSMDEIFKSIDTDGDGSISQEEFEAATGGEESVEDQFESMDMDHDGKIDSEEFDPEMNPPEQNEA